MADWVKPLFFCFGVIFLIVAVVMSVAGLSTLFRTKDDNGAATAATATAAPVIRYMEGGLRNVANGTLFASLVKWIYKVMK